MIETPLQAGFRNLGGCLMSLKAISKSNEKHKGHWLSPKYKAYEETIAILTRSAFGSKRYSKGWIQIQCYFKTKTHCDLNNIPKSLFDGMKKGGVLLDDKNFSVTVAPAIYCDRDSIEVCLWV